MSNIIQYNIVLSMIDDGCACVYDHDESITEYTWRNKTINIIKKRTRRIRREINLREHRDNNENVP